MTYHLICTFHPEIAVFPYPRKGAWRVIACVPVRMLQTYLRVQLLAHIQPKQLIVVSLRRRQLNSWVSPFKVLKEWQREQSRQRTFATMEQYPCERGSQVRPWA